MLDYTELEEFIRKRMRMTHIYQPLMIKTLLESDDDTATVTDIAKKFLNEDMSQIRYYEAITKRWPHQTLKKHKVISYHKNRYRLLVDRALTSEQRDKLVELCNLRLKEFIDKDPWIKRMRELDENPITGGIRYSVLAKSGGSCMACGRRSTETLLHVDHIMPRSRGGPTNLDNLQALCYQCNTEKRDRDETDFARIHNRLKYRNKRCKICGTENEVRSNSLARIIRPPHPETECHFLVTPKSHVESFAELILPERQMCLELVGEAVSDMGGRNDTESFSITRIEADEPDGHCHISVLSQLQKAAC